MPSKLTEAQRMRTDSAMLESLSTTFRIAADGGPFICSFNFHDVADLLARASSAVRPRLALAEEGRE